MRSNTSTLLDTVLTDPLTQGYIGFFVGATPIRWVVTNLNPPSTSINVVPAATGTAAGNYIFGAPRNLSIQGDYFPNVQIQYMPLTGTTWVTYDSKNCDSPLANDMYYNGAENGFFSPNNGAWMNDVTAFDPRCNRFCSIAHRSNQGGLPPDSTSRWVNIAEGTVGSKRTGMSAGYPSTWPNNYELNLLSWLFPSSIGWYPGQQVFDSSPSPNGIQFRPGLFEQNDPTVKDDARNYDGGGAATTSGNDYYSDADGVVRRAAGAWVGPSASGTISASSTVGLPMALACVTGSNPGQPLTQNGTQTASRPMILNRPFRSVADLGYVFSGTPFKNLDFFTPESGYAGLLDVFCIMTTLQSQQPRGRES